MNFRNKKFYLSLLLVMTMIFSNFGVLYAQQDDSLIRPTIYTESMEIRTQGTLGLRIIASINQKYIEKLKKENKSYEYGIVAVPATVYEANEKTKELEVGESFTYSGKKYDTLTVPAKNDWSVESDRITFTGVLTGISGKGFNTRYAARAYVKVDGKYIYGDIIKESAYGAAKQMASSPDVEQATKKFVKEKVMDACDKARGSYTSDTLTISSSNLTSGVYNLNTTTNSNIRNYKKVIIDSSVTGGTINISDVKIGELEIAGEASGTINVEETVLDTISKTDVSKTSRSAGNVKLNLGDGTGLETLNIASNITVAGTAKVNNVVVSQNSNIKLDIPVAKLEVKGNYANVAVNGIVDNVVLEGTKNTITGTGSYVNVENKGDNTVEIKGYEENSIKSVTVNGMYGMTVVLEKPTSKALTKEDMAILCRGGKDMTILSVNTTDNQTYKVSTSVFAKDDYYTFSIEVAPGKIIDKTFSYKVNNPTVTNAVVTRTEGTRAEFDLYDVDEGGYVYVYIPGVTQVQGKTKATEEITTDLVKKGYKQDLKTGFNKVILKGLTEEIRYDVYYVLESYDGRTSDVHGPLAINGSVQEETNLSKKYQIVSVSESTKNNITVKLNRAPEEELTLSNFSFICPSDSELTIDNATLRVSEDKLTYTIIIPENYGHKDNQYTAKITFSDGTIAKKTFVVELTPPRVTNQKVERTAENKVKYTFTSDKAGEVYVGTYTWNGAANSENNTPKGQDILSGEVESKKIVMNAGFNEVEITYNGTDKDIFALHVDQKETMHNILNMMIFQIMCHR